MMLEVALGHAVYGRLTTGEVVRLTDRGMHFTTTAQIRNRLAALKMGGEMPEFTSFMLRDDNESELFGPVRQLACILPGTHFANKMAAVAAICVMRDMETPHGADAVKFLQSYVESGHLVWTNHKYYVVRKMIL
jgi:hypothetical protein